MNEVIVNRELKMIELKKGVEKLEEKMKKPIQQTTKNISTEMFFGRLLGY